MLAILVAIRDFLLAAALAWVGVTVEHPHASTDQNCSGQACQTRDHD